MDLKNYVKDNRTGELITLEKFKPDTIVKGTGKIELFNAATGELEVEAGTENCITDFASNMAYMDYFYGRIKKDTNVQFGGLSTLTRAPFQYIMLTDYNKPEDKKAESFLGLIMGYADKTLPYSGADNKCGTINVNETTFVTDTVTGKARFHFVFDFPTNAANGTFQTLWWTRETARQKNVTHGSFLPNLTASVTDITIQNGSCYSIVANYILNKTKCIAETGFTSYTATTTIAAASIPTSMFGITNDDTYIYIISEKTKISKYTDTNDIFAKVSDITLDTAIPSTDIVAGLCLANSYFYILHSNNTTCFISKYDISGVFISKVDLSTIANNSGYIFGLAGNIKKCLTYDPWRNLFYISNFNSNSIENKEIIAYSEENNDLEYCAISSAYASRGVCFFSKYKAIVQNSGSGSGQLCFVNCLNYNVGAQTLLAAPITKTSANTMKITYDFVMDYIDLSPNIVL